MESYAFYKCNQCYQLTEFRKLVMMNLNKKEKKDSVL